ncbi:MAG: ABC transporter permease [Acidobacteriota bacterium]
MNAIGAVLVDLRYACRTLLQRPLFLTAAVFSIALGAGLNLGIYSVLHRILFDAPLAAAAPDQLVRIEPGVSVPNYQDLRRAASGIDLAGMQMTSLSWYSDGGTRALSAHVVSDNWFETVGVRPILGRTLTTADDGRDVVVLSFPFWQRHFNSDPTALGRSLDLNGWPHTIIGVLPRGFAVTPLVGGMVFVLIGPHVATGLDNRRAAQLDLIGRLHLGVSPSTALAALHLTAIQLEHDFPGGNPGFAAGLRVSPPDAFSMFRQFPTGRAVIGAAATLFGMVGLVLVIACTNVAGLLLVRADERRHELAIRIALGATRGRLIQQMLAECVVIAACGCAVGVGLWLLAVTVLQQQVANVVTTDVTLLLASVRWGYFALLIPLVTLACGLAASVRISHLTTRGLPAAVGRHRRGARLQRALVTTQITVCFVLLVAAALFLENIVALRPGAAGFDIDHLLAVEVHVPAPGTARDLMMVRSALVADGSVSAVTWGSPLGPPFAERFPRVWPDDGGGGHADIRAVGPGFFATMQIGIVRGRDIADSDIVVGDRLHVVVNESFVRRYLTGVDPIGARLTRLGNPDSGRLPQALRVVGVARDTMARTIGESRVPVVYLPQVTPSLTVRVGRVSGRAMAELRDRILRLEPPGSVVDVTPLATGLAVAVRPVQAVALVLAILGGFALALAGTGLFAIVSYAASQRTVEFGIRAALGATRHAIARMVIANALRVVGAGCACGAVLASLLARAAQTVLTEQTIASPARFAEVAGVLLIVGVTASVWPALRAAGADPVEVLRHE